MRKSLIALALGTTLTAGIAFANQPTIDAITSTGIALSPEQLSLLEAAQTDTSILNAIVSILPQTCNDPSSVEQFISAVVSANPGLSDQIFEAAVSTCPDMIASIATGILEGQAPAAGIEGTDGSGTGGIAPGTQTLAAGPGAPRTPTAGGTPSSPN